MSHTKTIVTSALPYVNNVPHLGNIICIISADIYTRFLRIAGHEVISVLGTDEHGTTSEVVALSQNKTPKQVCDEFFAIHKDIYEWFNTSFDCLGRSSDPENAQITTDIYSKLAKNGFIVEKTISQYYDPQKNRFLADRFIRGTCPHCGFEDARGDQCDSCGKLLEPSELKEPKSTISDATPILKETTHKYIDLPKLKPQLDSFFAERKKKWSKNAQAITKSWLDGDLQPRAITRDLKWGIQVPDAPDKVFYSWFDAPIAYIGITASCRDDWKEWWFNDSDVRLVQFMGKDNTSFHTVLFPSFLLGTGDAYTLLDSIAVNEYLTYEGGKFSKSRGTGVFGTDAKKTGIPADVFRYYLTAIRPEQDDTNFSWDDFAQRLNKELIGNYGNLLNRLVIFVSNKFDGKVPEMTKSELDLHADFAHIHSLYEAIELKEALRATMAVSKKLNQYFQENEPWKAEPTASGNIIANLLNAIVDVSIALSPVIPDVSKRALEQLNTTDSTWKTIGKAHFSTGDIIAGGKPLLSKLEDEDVKGLKRQFGGDEEEFPLDLRVAEITEVTDHPDADKLFIEKLDLGDGKTRQIVSGLKGHYSKEELLGKKIILVQNLKPAKLRGVMSEGMLLAGEDAEGTVKVLEAKMAKVGESVGFDGFKTVSEQITYDQFAKVKMKVQNGNVIFKKKKLQSAKEVIGVDLGQGVVR